MGGEICAVTNMGLQSLVIAGIFNGSIFIVYSYGPTQNVYHKERIPHIPVVVKKNWDHGEVGMVGWIRDMIECTSTHICTGSFSNLMVLVQSLHCCAVVDISCQAPVVQLSETPQFLSLVTKLPFMGGSCGEHDLLVQHTDLLLQSQFLRYQETLALRGILRLSLSPLIMCLNTGKGC